MLVPCLTLATALLLGFPPALQDQDVDVAAAVLKCIEKMNSDDWQVWSQGEEELKALGNDAIPHLRKVLQEKGDQLKRKADLQEILDEMEGNVAEAAIKKLFPPDGSPGTFDGQTKPVLADLGEDAERLLTLVLKTTFRETPVRTLAATALGQLGKPTALPALEEIWKDEWEGEEVRVAVAQAMERLGKPEAFNGIVQKAEAFLKENPKDLGVMFRLGGLYRHKKDLANCEAMWRKAIEVDGKNVTAHYNLACTLAVAGKTEDSLSMLESAVAKGYKEIHWLEMDEDLSSIRGEDRYKALVKKLKGS